MGANDLIGRLRRLATRQSWQIEEAWRKGSHLKVKLNGRRTVIPFHRGDIPHGTFRQIKKDLGLTDADLEV